ncbi:hypothetical protein EON64_20370 [archaeon]|nr:MAG: hypothetical protein EON64_20370 [archaeon]
MSMASKLLRQYEYALRLEPMFCAGSPHPCCDAFCYLCLSAYLSKTIEQKCPCCQNEEKLA